MIHLTKLGINALLHKTIILHPNSQPVALVIQKLNQWTPDISIPGLAGVVHELREVYHGLLFAVEL